MPIYETGNTYPEPPPERWQAMYIEAAADVERLRAERDALAARVGANESVRHAATTLAAIVLEQTSGYLSGPGFDAAQAARKLQAALDEPSAIGAATRCTAPTPRAWVAGLGSSRRLATSAPGSV